MRANSVTNQNLSSKVSSTPPNLPSSVAPICLSPCDGSAIVSCALASQAHAGLRHGIADSGSTGMYLAPRDAQHLQMQPASAPASVHTASNQVVRSTHTAFLDWPTMPASTRQGHVFSEFGSSLISVPMLADAQLTTTFTSRGVFVTRDLGDPQHTDVIMQGGRNARGLFELPLSYTIPSAMASPTSDCRGCCCICGGRCQWSL